MSDGMDLEVVGSSGPGFRKLTLVHIYSLTNDTSVESKDVFFEQLESAVQKCSRNDILLITRDLNA